MATVKLIYLLRISLNNFQEDWKSIYSKGRLEGGEDHLGRDEETKFTKHAR